MEFLPRKFVWFVSLCSRRSRCSRFIKFKDGITLDDELFSNLIAASAFRKRLLFTYKELPDLSEAEMYLELLKKTIREVRSLFPAEYQNIFEEEITIQLL